MRADDPLGAKIVTAKHLMFHNPALPVSSDLYEKNYIPVLAQPMHQKDVAKYSHKDGHDSETFHLSGRNPSPLEHTSG